MKFVRVPGQDVTYPQVCACCLARSTTTLEVRKEDLASLAKAGLLVAAGSSGGGLMRENRAVKVPYCKECSGHVRWKQSGGWLGVVLHVPVNAFFGLLLGFLVALLAGAAGLAGESASLDHPNWFIVGAFVAVGVAFALATTRWRPRGPLGRAHARDGGGVEIARFNQAEIVLRCHNDGFAARLIEANPGSALSRVA